MFTWQFGACCWFSKRHGACLHGSMAVCAVTCFCMIVCCMPMHGCDAHLYLSLCISYRSLSDSLSDISLPECTQGTQTLQCMHFAAAMNQHISSFIWSHFKHQAFSLSSEFLRELACLLLVCCACGNWHSLVPEFLRELALLPLARFSGSWFCCPWLRFPSSAPK